MIGLLINLLILAIVLAIVYWIATLIITAMALPPVALLIVKAILGLILLVWLLDVFSGWSGAAWPYPYHWRH